MENYGKSMEQILTNVEKIWENIEQHGQTYGKYGETRRNYGVNNGTLECHEEQTGVLRWKVMLS